MMLTKTNQNYYTGPVGALILAAGRSQRMGQTKALLNLPPKSVPHTENTTTFVEYVLEILSQSNFESSSIAVGVNPDTKDSIQEVCPSHTKIVVNNSPEDGMLSSICCALDQGFRPKKMLVTLVDIPEINPRVVKAMILHQPSDEKWICLPRFEDGLGHPLVLYDSVFTHLNRSLEKGLKTLMEKHPEKIEEIPFDGGQPWDVDTPEDYARFSDPRSPNR